MTEERVLSQHFHADGTPKRKYPSPLAAARAAAAAQQTNESDRPVLPYECYCGWFHIGKSRSLRDSDEAKRTMLRANGWYQLDNPDQERWARSATRKNLKKGQKRTLEQAYMILMKDLSWEAYQAERASRG